MRLIRGLALVLVGIPLVAVFWYFDPIWTFPIPTLAVVVVGGIVGGLRKARAHRRPRSARRPMVTP